MADAVLFLMLSEAELAALLALEELSETLERAELTLLLSEAADEADSEALLETEAADSEAEETDSEALEEASCAATALMRRVMRTGTKRILSVLGRGVRLERD